MENFVSCGRIRRQFLTREHLDIFFFIQVFCLNWPLHYLPHGRRNVYLLNRLQVVPPLWGVSLEGWLLRKKLRSLLWCGITGTRIDSCRSLRRSRISWTHGSRGTITSSMRRGGVSRPHAVRCGAWLASRKGGCLSVCSGKGNIRAGWNFVSFYWKNE